MADSRAAAFFNNGGSDPTPLTAGALVLLALVGVYALRKLRFSVNASI
jgi:hypothetical protein